MKTVVDKVFRVGIEEEDELAGLVRALDCRTRRRILRLLSIDKMSIKEISETLKLPKSTISEHVKVLINSGLVSVAKLKSERGNSRVITRQYERISISIMQQTGETAHRESVQHQIPIGSYTDYRINQYCGIVGKDGYIGMRDDKTSFSSPYRFMAQLIWFDYGYLEYTVPMQMLHKDQITSVTLSMELCSEAPGYDENWKSDIYFEMNGHELCTYTCPGDFGARRGALTPDWWYPGTQYGLMKELYVTERGTYLDGNLVSSVTVRDLSLADRPALTFRIGVREDARHRGGLNLFGKKFGDYSQNIFLSINFDDQSAD